MAFLIVVLLIILFLCLIIVKGTFLQFSVFTVTKEKVTFTYTIIPSFLSLIIHFILLSTTSVVLSKFNISILKIVYYNMFKIEYPFRNILYLLIAYMICEIIYLFLQAFILKLISFDWVSKVNVFSNKLLKEKTQSLQEHNDCDNLLPIAEKSNYFNRFLSSLVCSVFYLAVFFILFSLGKFLSSILFKVVI